MDEVFYRSEKEQQQVAAFIREKKEEFDRMELEKKGKAFSNNETYEPKEFPGVDEREALAAVRDGWKSKLDLAFERKRKRESKTNHGGILLTEEQIKNIEKYGFIK